LDIGPSAAGFNANHVPTDQESTIDALAHLATTTAEDRKAVANLRGTDATLTKELATSNGKLILALRLVTTLTKQIADFRTNNSTPSPANSTTTHKHYCWTCGYRSEHSSWYCPTPRTGHQTVPKPPTQ
jgi:hypothetical protein